MRTVPKEPWRLGQICGRQLEYGRVPGRSLYCGERKANGLHFCQPCHGYVMAEYGRVRVAPGNAVGDPSEPVRLWWESLEGDGPEKPTQEEISDWMTCEGV